jgi:GLPGLI family protein
MMMNRKMLNFLLYFCIVEFTALSQTDNKYAKVKVSYGITAYLDKDVSKHQFLLRTFPEVAPKMESVSSEFDFTLIFDDSLSIFYAEKKIYSDNRVAKLVGLHIEYFGRIKQLPKKYITEELQEDFGKFLVSRPYQKWEFHDETKKIGDYLCFKATTYHTVTSPQGKVFKYDFTAWYSPQLPYKFGPAGYGNLPGLIIELQGDSFTYGVTKIDFYENLQNEEIEMPKLKKLKLISEEEFEALAAEDEKRRQKRN